MSMGTIVVHLVLMIDNYNNNIIIIIMRVMIILLPVHVRGIGLECYLSTTPVD